MYEYVCEELKKERRCVTIRILKDTFTQNEFFHFTVLLVGCQGTKISVVGTDASKILRFLIPISVPEQKLLN